MSKVGGVRCCISASSPPQRIRAELGLAGKADPLQILNHATPTPCNSYRPANFNRASLQSWAKRVREIDSSWQISLCSTLSSFRLMTSASLLLRQPMQKASCFSSCESSSSRLLLLPWSAINSINGVPSSPIFWSSEEINLILPISAHWAILYSFNPIISERISGVGLMFFLSSQ